LSLCSKHRSLLFYIYKIFLKHFITKRATFRVVYELHDKASGVQFFSLRCTQFPCTLRIQDLVVAMWIQDLVLEQVYESRSIKEETSLKRNMDSNSNMQPPTFAGKNYEMWSLTMKALFRGQYVCEMVENGYVEPVDHATYNALTQAKKDVLKDQRNKDGKALFYIHEAMHESILPRVASTKKAKEAWDIL
jgi:hypothetical protein